MRLTPYKLNILIDALQLSTVPDTWALREELKEELARCVARANAVTTLLEQVKGQSLATSAADKLAREILIPVLVEQNILLEDIKQGQYYVEWACLERDLITLVSFDGGHHQYVNFNSDGTMDWL